LKEFSPPTFAQNTFGQCAFIAVQADDVLFHRALQYQTIYRDRVQLPHAVGAPHSLVFGGRISPRVGDDRVIGGGQIEAMD